MLVPDKTNVLFFLLNLRSLKILITIEYNAINQVSHTRISITFDVAKSTKGSRYLMLIKRAEMVVSEKHAKLLFLGNTIQFT